MMRKACAIFILFVALSLSATLLGDESNKKYFPNTLGSFWVYEDQDGNELTRRSIEGEEIADEIYLGFSYEPELKDWADFNRYLHPPLYHVGDEWIRFVVGDEVEKAVKARLTKEMDAFAKLAKNSIEKNAPPDLNVTVNVNYEVEVEAADQFNLLSRQAAPDEEWDATQINAKINLEFDIQGLPDFQDAADIPTIVLDFSIHETGKIIGTETVETAAGTFENCLKVEYRTETKTTASQSVDTGDVPGESVTTLWFAPNVGIVKFHQKSDKIFLHMISERDAVDSLPSDEEAAEFTATSVKTFELKKYEIVSEPPQDDNN